MLSRITKNIFISGSREANNRKILNSLHPQTIINLQWRTKDKNLTYARHKWLPLHDTQNDPQKINQVLNYIQKRITMGKTPILIHCSGGRSRSPSIVAAYLVQAGWFPNYTSAINSVKAIHPLTRPKERVFNQFRIIWR